MANMATKESSRGLHGRKRGGDLLILILKKEPKLAQEN